MSLARFRTKGDASPICKVRPVRPIQRTSEPAAANIQRFQFLAATPSERVSPTPSPTAPTRNAGEIVDAIKDNPRYLDGERTPILPTPGREQERERGIGGDRDQSQDHKRAAPAFPRISATDARRDRIAGRRKRQSATTMRVKARRNQRNQNGPQGMKGSARYFAEIVREVGLSRSSADRPDRARQAPARRCRKQAEAPSRTIRLRKNLAAPSRSRLV